MMRLPNFFRRTPDPQAEIFAEALALYEEGMEIAAILERYTGEVQDWLKPLLSTGQIIGGAFEAEEASYYFEGALKAKVLAAAQPVIGGAPEPPLPAPPRFGQLGAALASVAVLVVAGMLGVITFGFVTAEESVPGEWNYGFKRATEQAQVRFASGDERINVRISIAQERIDEIQTLVLRGDLSEGHIDSFTSELDDIRELAEEESFDSLQQAKVRSLSETAEVVLSETEEELASEAEEAIEYAAEVAAAVSTDTKVKPLDEPTATPEATSEPEATPTPDPAAATETPTSVETPPTSDPAADPTVSTGVDEDPQALATPTDETPVPTVTTGVDEDPQPLTTPEDPSTDGGDGEPTSTPTPTPTPTPDDEGGTQ